MAMTITTLKNTNQETVIHFASSAAESGTVTIANLTASTQALTVGGTPTVNIVKWQISGELASKVTISRNSKLVIACAPENAPYAELNAWGIPLTNDNTFDIVIANGAAKDVTGILVLRKVAGWSTKVEDATYGAYDDPTRVGASTSLSGSPDKV
jgi:hypothetical protein